MTMTPAEVEALGRAGIEALRAGDPHAARLHFDRIAGAGGQAPWMALAQACRMLDDSAGEEAALQRILSLQMRNIPALLAMGELKARQKDDRSAGSFFRAAIKQAAVTTQLAPQLQPLLDRAQAFIAQAGQRFESQFLARVEETGLDRGHASPRVRYAIDLLLGKAQLYQQQPNMFYFPGLPQRAFYEREEFDWIADFEARTPAMKAELEAILADDREFAPYVEGATGRPLPNNPLLNDPSWGALYFWQSGETLEANASRAPATMATLEGAPMPVIAKRSPMALYSLLKPGTHIEPHNGMLNTRLICHLPLLAPPDCALRAGHETRPWEEGRMLIFDDSFEHEAWNHSESTRVVLLFEIWRPEIDEEERRALTLLFEGIDLQPAEDAIDG